MTFTSIIKVDVKRGSRLKDVDRLGRSDPYVLIKFQNDEAHPHQAASRVAKGSVDPTWDESFYFLVKDDCEFFNIEVYDHDALEDDTLKEEKLGYLTFVREDDLSKREQLKGGVLDLNQGNGQLEVYFKEYVIPGGVDGVDQLKKENLQLLKVQIHRAFNLKSEYVDKTDAYVRLAFTRLDEGDRVSGNHWKTKKVKNNRNPVWNQTLEMCISAHQPSFRVEVFADDHTNDEPIAIGYADIELNETCVRDNRYHLTHGDIELSYDKTDISHFF